MAFLYSDRLHCILSLYLDCFYRLGHLEFALCDYQQALELEPGDWEVYCRLAVVYGEVGVELFRKRDYLRAEELFSAAIQHNPKVSHFYICRARARYQLKVRDYNNIWNGLTLGL